MSTCASSYRLEGLEPDNLLAFLALLGVLRALEEAERGLRDDERWWPRVSWSIGAPPWRPQLHLAKDVERPKLLDRLESGIRLFKAALDFGNRKMPNFEPTEYRSFAVAISQQADARLRLDALAAVATDHTLDDDDSTSATPLCLMTGQGHQFFSNASLRFPFYPRRKRRRQGFSTRTELTISSARCSSRGNVGTPRVSAASVGIPKRRLGKLSWRVTRQTRDIDLDLKKGRTGSQ